MNHQRRASTSLSQIHFMEHRKYWNGVYRPLVILGLVTLMVLNFAEMSLLLRNADRAYSDNQSWTPRLLSSDSKTLKRWSPERQFLSIDEKVDEIEKAIRNGEKLFLFNVGDGGKHGLGSFTNNMLLLQSFFHAFQNRSSRIIIVQDELNRYRFNETHGVFDGFWDTSHIVVNTREEMDEIQNRLETAYPEAFAHKDEVWGISSNNTWYDPTYDAPIVTVTAMQKLYARYAAFDFYGTKTNPSMYHDMATSLCTAVGVSEETQLWTEEILARNAIPRLTSTAASNGGDSTSASFHIRRTDKKHESRYFSAEEYVMTLEKALQNDTEKLGAIKHCFVATDDYDTVCELQEALDRRGTIKCQLHTLTPQRYKSTRRSKDTFLFMSQLQMLVDATYFVGSFSSNVGILASLFRACPTVLSKDKFDTVSSNNWNHYFHSYGVDVFDWSMW